MTPDFSAQGHEKATLLLLPSILAVLLLFLLIKQSLIISSCFSLCSQQEHLTIVFEMTFHLFRHHRNIEQVLLPDYLTSSVAPCLTLTERVFYTNIVHVSFLVVYLSGSLTETSGPFQTVGLTHSILIFHITITLKMIH